MEVIKVAWLRDGQEEAAFEVAVRDTEMAWRLFDRIAGILRAAEAGQGGAEPEGAQL